MKELEKLLELGNDINVKIKTDKNVKVKSW